MKKIFTVVFLLFLSYQAFSQVPLYRYYNNRLKMHWYTVNFNKLGNGANGWVLEGPQCRVFTAPDAQRGIVPFSSYYNAQTADHYYTVRRLILPNYTDSGPEGFIALSQLPATIPLYEYYNSIVHTHFYTTDKAELGRGGFDGFILAGIIGYVYPAR